MNIVKAVFADAPSQGDKPGGIGEIIKGDFPFEDLGTLIGSIITGILFILGLVVFVFILQGGFMYITSGGDAEKVSEAGKKITYAILGAVIIIASYALLRVITDVLDLGRITDYATLLIGSTFA